MKLTVLTSSELLRTKGGAADVIIPGDNGNYYDDGSGQGCIKYPKGFSPTP